MKYICSSWSNKLILLNNMKKINILLKIWNILKTETKIIPIYF